nr:phage terminase small subunit P27 family [Lacticaseibacillus parakribbianus]
MGKSAFNAQNGGQLSKDPPKYFGRIAAATWRRIVPFLMVQGHDVRRIDQSLVEMYCTQYEIYRKAYESIKKNGAQTEAYRSVQNNRGEVIGKDFLGYKRNPATSIYNDALKQLASVGAQLGLSPKSRAELAELVGSTSPSGDVDVGKALKNLLGGGADD